MTAKEVAERLGVTRQTVTRMVRDGRLIPITPKRDYLKRQRLLFDRAAIEQMAAG